MRTENREGSILIVVLLVLAAATYLMMESGKFLRIDYEGAAYQRVNASGGSLLQSGMTVANELLLDDVKTSGLAADHRFEAWSHANDFYKDISLYFESGEIEGHIVAEDGKISLNSLRGGGKVEKAVAQIFVSLVDGLSSAHGLEAKGDDYLASIKIWLGDNDTRGDKVWYDSREPAYSRAGDKFRTPHELLLVRWEGVGDADRKKVFYGANGIPGLLEFITVWGTGKINVNMASREVLGAMCPNSDLRLAFVDACETYRSHGENMFTALWIKDLAVMTGIDPAKFPEQALDVKSTVFRVDLTAFVGAGKIHSTTILKRESDSCVVLFENLR